MGDSHRYRAARPIEQERSLVKDATTVKLLAALRRHDPFKVRAYNGEDDTRDIAVPQRRKRWATVISAIEAKAWTRVELLDKSGAVLGYAENEGGARDVEELSPSFVGVGGQLLLGERIAQLCMRSVQLATASRDDEMKALLQAQGEVVREMVTAVKSLGEVYRDRSDAAEDAAESRMQAAAMAAEAAGGDFKQLLEALPTLMQAMPMLRALLAGGPTQAVSNGVRKE